MLYLLGLGIIAPSQEGEVSGAMVILLVLPLTGGTVGTFEQKNTPKLANYSIICFCTLYMTVEAICFNVPLVGRLWEGAMVILVGLMYFRSQIRLCGKCNDSRLQCKVSDLGFI